MSNKQSKCTQKWPQDGPERPKPLPNGAPRFTQIRFSSTFWVCLFLVANLHFYFAVLWQNVFVFLRGRPSKFMRPRSVLLTSTRLGMFRKTYQKSSKNPPET